MSFQVYLQIFHGGKPAGIALQFIRDVFSGLLVELEEDYWQVNFSISKLQIGWIQPTISAPILAPYYG